MKRAPKPTLFLILIGVTILAGAGSAFLLWGRIQSSMQEIANLKRDAREPEELEKELATVSAQVDESRTRLAHLERNVPQFAYIPTMLRELEQMGRSKGIEVFGARPVPVVVDPKSKKKRAPYEELTIEIKGRGTYPNALAFIDALKTFPKVVAARSVTIVPSTAANREQSGGTLDITVELRAYLFPQDEIGEGTYTGTIRIDLESGKTIANFKKENAEVT
ncbi:MAG: type 4a pilus biogenesis protein PilO, partial [Fimbriimonadaceae bacterium]